MITYLVRCAHPTFLLVIAIILLLTYFIFIIFVHNAFWENYKIKDAFNISKLSKIIKMGLIDLIISCIWIIVIEITLLIPLSIITYVLQLLNKSVASITDNIIGLILSLVGINLFAQTYKIAKQKIEMANLSESIIQNSVSINL